MTLDVDLVNNFLTTESGMLVNSFSVVDLEPDFALCRYTYDPVHQRPGGYISGPTVMNLIDMSVWVAIFTRAGIVPMAVTWDLHASFLRPAIGRDLLAEAKLLKFGRLSYATVEVFHEDDRDRPTAHATVTYSVPQRDEQLSSEHENLGT